MPLRALILRGGAGVLACNVAAIGVAFGINVLLARVMGTTNYGVYILVLTWVNLLVVLSKLGLDTTLVRLVAASLAAGDWGSLRGAKAFATMAAIAAGGVVGLGILLFAHAGPSEIRPDVARVLLAAALLLPLLTVIGVEQATLRGFKRPVLADIPDNLGRPILVGAMVAATAATVPGDRVSAATVMSYTAAAAVVTLGITMALRVGATPAPLTAVPARYSRGRWIRIAAPLWLMAGMNLILTQVDILMVGAFVGPEEAGIYAVASRLAGFAGFGLSAVNAIFAPVIAELYARGAREELARSARFVSLLVGSFSLPACGVLVAFGGPLLALFGDAFVDGNSALRILVLGQLVNCLCGPVGFLLTMTGHEQRAMAILGAATGASLLLNLLLIPVWGIEGAALGSAFAMALWNALMLAHVVRKLGINPTLWGGWRHEAT